MLSLNTYQIPLLKDKSLSYIKKQVARILIEHTKHGTSGISKLSQREMATLIGASWIQVNQSLGILQEEGAIRIDRHRLIINRESMEKAVGEALF